MLCLVQHTCWRGRSTSLLAEGLHPKVLTALAPPPLCGSGQRGLSPSIPQLPGLRVPTDLCTVGATLSPAASPASGVWLPRGGGPSHLAGWLTVLLWNHRVLGPKPSSPVPCSVAPLLSPYQQGHSRNVTQGEPSPTAHLQAVGPQTARASLGWALSYFWKGQAVDHGAEGSTTRCANEVGLGEPQQAVCREAEG